MPGVEEVRRLVEHMQASCAIELHEDLLVCQREFVRVNTIWRTKDWTCCGHSEQCREGCNVCRLHPEFFTESLDDE